MSKGGARPVTWSSWRNRNILETLYSQDPLKAIISEINAKSPIIRQIFGDNREAGLVFLPDFRGKKLEDVRLIKWNHFKPSHPLRQDPRLMALHFRRSDVLIEPCLEFEVKTLAKIISSHCGCSLEDSRLWVLNHVMFMNAIVFGMYFQ